MVLTWVREHWGSGGARRGGVVAAAEEGRAVGVMGLGGARGAVWVLERGVRGVRGVREVRWGWWAGRARRWAAGGELGWAQKFGDFVVGWSFAGWAAAIEWQRKRGEVWRGAVAVWRDVAVVGEPLGWMWETWWEGAGAR